MAIQELRVALFLNGEISSPAAIRQQLRAADVLAAVDGGLRHLSAIGLQPQVLIGDLDSVSTEDVQRLKKAGCTIHKFPAEKDETDFELALDWAVGQSYHEIMVFGALGGRLDQMLANLFLLGWERLAACQVSFIGDNVTITVIRRQAEITGKPGDTISLLPLHGAAHAIHTQGLKYPLHNETLFPDRSRGISNELTGASARISLDAGLLLCIHLHKNEQDKELT